MKTSHDPKIRLWQQIDVAARARCMIGRSNRELKWRLLNQWPASQTSHGLDDTCCPYGGQSRQYAKAMVLNVDTGNRRRANSVIQTRARILSGILGVARVRPSCSGVDAQPHLCRQRIPGPLCRRLPPLPQRPPHTEREGKSAKQVTSRGQLDDEATLGKKGRADESSMWLGPERRKSFKCTQAILSHRLWQSCSG